MNETSRIVVSNAFDIESDGFSRLQSDNVLAPGYYWRAMESIGQENKTWNRTQTILDKGDVVLLLDVFEFEGNAHSVEVLQPPGDGGRETYKFLVEDFFAKFEPCHDAEAVRQREQAQIMQKVQDIQDEMAQAEINPLMLPGVKDAAEKAVTEFEREEEREVNRAEKSDAERQKDLRRVHRRASRRSEAAGNPLVVQQVVVSNQLSDMINGGVNSDGLQELTMEARRRTAIATATSKWLTERVEAMGRTMQMLTPFYAERGKVALARSKKAISFAEEITKGLKSLELYTGDGVDVVSIRHGLSASTAVPLTLVQSKRYMAEEIAVFVDIDDNFNFDDQSKFFDRLAVSDELRDVVFPTKRCVVSMATNRHKVSYDKEMSSYEVAVKDAANRAVFLLVRDGDNIHVVYSSEPSHEAASRLFPSNDDIEAPFRGLDGTKITLKDVAFSKATQRFDDRALHYKRFLILLCGLDHRMKLMGEFYPPENMLQFMSLDFQAKYFHFLEDDAPGTLLGKNLEPVQEWMQRCNANIRSGSRVMLTRDAVYCSPGLKRLNGGFKILDRDLTRPLVVSREGKNHFVTAQARGGYHDETHDAKIWLDGPDAREGGHFFCLDLVRQPVIHEYIHSRTSRSTSIGWLRIFKRVEILLNGELKLQEPLRNHLRSVAVEYGGQDAASVEESMEMAILSWRAGHRGADAPFLDNKKAVNEILTLMYPSSKIAQSIDGMLTKLIEDNGFKPLRLARTGKTRLALYVETTQVDRAPYAQGCKWGWVKRLVLDPLKTKLSIASDALVWMEKGKVDPTEEEVKSWPEMNAWLNEHPEPVGLRRLEKFTQQMAQAVAVFGDLLAKHRAQPAGMPIEQELFDQIKTRYGVYYRTASAYSNGPRISIPVGVHQEREGGAIAFLYMECSVRSFVKQYGSEQQGLELVQVARSYGFRNLKPIDANKSVSWHLTSSTDAFIHWVNEGAHNRPDFSTLRIQKNRPFKKDSFFRHSSEKSKGNGKPRLTEEVVYLSLNRSFDALMGVAPHIKRNFYKSIAEEIRRNASFSDFDGKLSVKQKRLRERVFLPSAAPRFLSALVWDDAKGRSMACKFFPIKRDIT